MHLSNILLIVALKILQLSNASRFGKLQNPLQNLEIRVNVDEILMEQVGVTKEEASMALMANHGDYQGALTYLMEHLAIQFVMNKAKINREMAIRALIESNYNALDAVESVAYPVAVERDD